MGDKEFTNYDALPLVLKISHIVKLFQISESKLRHEIQRGEFQPEPFMRNPYRWRKSDVIDYLERPTKLRALRIVNSPHIVVVPETMNVAPLDFHRK